MTPVLIGSRASRRHLELALKNGMNSKVYTDRIIVLFFSKTNFTRSLKTSIKVKSSSPAHRHALKEPTLPHKRPATIMAISSPPVTAAFNALFGTKKKKRTARWNACAGMRLFCCCVKTPGTTLRAGGTKRSVSESVGRADGAPNAIGALFRGDFRRGSRQSAFRAAPRCTTPA